MSHSITTQSLKIENVHFEGAAPAMAQALSTALMFGAEAEVFASAADRSDRPAIGEVWPGQGGIYAGDFRGGDGTVYGLIVAKEEDVGTARWAPEGKRALSDWDGLINTAALRSDCPAAKLASDYVHDEHTDFYLPARRELQLAAANLHDTFGKESWYWTSTPQGEHFAWAVDFESGFTYHDFRTYEFRVRPFRRFIY